MSNNNAQIPDKPIYRCGAFKWLSRDETQCILCSTEDDPKILRTAKYSCSTLVGHLNIHADAKKKYETLMKLPTPITNYFVKHVGSVTPLDRKVVHFIAACYMPFSVVEHPTFHTLIGKHNEALKGIHGYVVERIRQQLSECVWLSFTCDVGSGPNCPFFALTAHGITADWERRRYVLAVREFPGSHTGAAVKDMAFKQDSIEDFLCGAHKTNLVVRNGMWPNPKKGELPTRITALLSKCRDVVAHFRHSHLATERLKRQLLHHGLDEKELIQDVVTRWDSTFLMVNRLLEQRLALDSYCVTYRQDLLLVDAEWTTIQAVHNLLLPFKEFSKVLGRDTSSLAMQVTAGKVLETELAVHRNADLRVEVEKMKKILSEKFGGVVLYKNAAVAHVLDPRFKDTVLVGRDVVDLRSSALAWITEHVAHDIHDLNDDVAVTSDLTLSPPAKKRSLLEGIRAKLIQNNGTRSGPSSSQPTRRVSDVETELLNYYGEPTIDWDSDPLLWWKENASRYSLLGSRFLL